MPDAGVLETLCFLIPTPVIQVDRPAITLTLYPTCTPFSFHMKGNDKRKQQNNKPNKQNESRQPYERIPSSRDFIILFCY